MTPNVLTETDVIKQHKSKPFSFHIRRLIKLTHTYPHKPLSKNKWPSTIISFCLWLDVWSDDLQACWRVWSYLTLNVLIQTKCYYLHNLKQKQNQSHVLFVCRGKEAEGADKGTHEVQEEWHHQAGRYEWYISNMNIVTVFFQWHNIMISMRFMSLLFIS